jgi:NAD+ diphosphatase
MKKPNIYAAGGIDRAAKLREDAGWVAERLADPLTRIAAVWRGRNLVLGEGEPAPHFLAPEAGLLGEARAVALLGLAGEVAHFAADISHLEAKAAAALGRFEDLRNIGLLMSHDDGALLAYARGIMHWHLAHLHCGRCGAPTEPRQAGHVRFCTNEACGLPAFPRTDPAVIMLIHHGEHVLLGRQKVWTAGMHSVLAGFVEPGESLEDAVAREAFEEAGVAVDEVEFDHAGLLRAGHSHGSERRHRRAGNRPLVPP